MGKAFRFTSAVKAEQYFSLVNGKLRGVWASQVEIVTKTAPKGEFVFIEDQTSPTGLMEAETEDKAMKKARAWLREAEKAKDKEEAAKYRKSVAASK